MRLTSRDDKTFQRLRKSEKTHISGYRCPQVLTEYVKSCWQGGSGSSHPPHHGSPFSALCPRGDVADSETDMILFRWPSALAGPHPPSRFLRELFPIPSSLVFQSLPQIFPFCLSVFYGTTNPKSNRRAPAPYIPLRPAPHLFLSLQY